MAPREVRGAIHVHSRYSDGSGSIEEIIEAGRAARLD
jgi:predicted metal-dependent phosphoesterase TrpH